MTQKAKRTKQAKRLVELLERDNAQYLLVYIDPEDQTGNYNIRHAGAKQLAWLFHQACTQHDLFAMLWVEMNAMRIASEITSEAKKN